MADGWIERTGFRFLASELLQSFGLEHGFGNRSLDARAENFAVVEAVFRQEFGARGVHALRQVHGARVVEVSDPAVYSHATPPEADGFLVARGKHARAAFLIRTADCLPVILASSGWVAILHAGWRGLAAGIVEYSIRRIAELEPDAAIAAYLGPCACQDAYEVGPEFLEQFPKGSFSRRDGTLYFGLRETARIQLENCGVASRLIGLSDVCSISDKNLFSHRREGSAAGRNVNFVIV